MGKEEKSIIIIIISISMLIIIIIIINFIVLRCRNILYVKIAIIVKIHCSSAVTWDKERGKKRIS